MSKVYQTLKFTVDHVQCTLLGCTYSSRHSRLEGLIAYFSSLMEMVKCACVKQGEWGELPRLGDGVEKPEVPEVVGSEVYKNETRHF